MKVWILPALLVLAAPIAAGEARADDPSHGGAASGPTPRAPVEPKTGAPASKAEEASQHFRSGVAFYKDKDFPAALVEFKHAYELVPNYTVLYNLGQTARELKDYAAALTAFERYLKEGGTNPPPAHRKEAQAAIDDLVKKVGRLKVTINVDGAELLVDDASVGTSPFAAPVTVNVGRRKLSASASGYEPTQRVVDVAVGDDEVTLELIKIAPPPSADTQGPPPKPRFPIYTWAALGATGATTLVTVILGGLAVSAHGSLETALGTFPGNPTTIAADQSRTRTFANATDAFIGITAAGAVATAALFVFGPRVTDKAKPAPTVGITPTGIVVRGSF